MTNQSSSAANQRRKSIVSRTLERFAYEGSPNEMWVRVRLSQQQEKEAVQDLNRYAEDGSTPSARLLKRRTSMNIQPHNGAPRYHFKRVPATITEESGDPEEPPSSWPADDIDNMMVSEMSNLIYLNPPNFVGSLKSRYTAAADQIDHLARDIEEKDASMTPPPELASPIKEATSRHSGCFYSSLGPVLLAVNPNKPVPELYDSKQIEKVWLERDADNLHRTSAPHPFVIADRALRRMSSAQENQSIIISGQSGAGKTECSKHLLKYLTTISARNHQASKLPVEDAATPSSKIRGGTFTNGGLEGRILQSNPILESFGNASTFRNYNSSRFGRLLNLLFNDKVVIEKCAIDTCLLAKSRVVLSPPGEQNYHILHVIADHMGAQARIVEQRMASSEDDAAMEEATSILFPLLEDELEHWGYHEGVALWRAGSGGFEVTKTNRAGSEGWESAVVPYSFEQLVDSFIEINVPVVDQLIIFRILLAILHLGNLQFEADESENAYLSEDTMRIVKRVESLLSMSSDVNLHKAFVSRVLVVGKEQITKHLSADSAEHEKKKLIMNLYELLFKVVVRLINFSLCPTPDGSPHTEDFTNAESLKKLGLSRISLLDIYGFEDMNPEGNNGFEQLCINYANEVLQDIFREQFLTDEMKLYEAEGINTTIRKTPQENHGLKDAFNCRHIGIWNLLNQQSEVSTKRLASHVTNDPDRIFCELVNTKTSSSYNNVILTTNRSQMRDNLVINHYSGDVVYEVKGFIDRNQDVFLRKDVAGIIRDHSFVDLRDRSPIQILQTVVDKTTLSTSAGRSNAFTSNATLFLSQLCKLKDELTNTNKWFIRCIKPNKVQSPGYFDDELVAEQLVSGGLLQVLDIMKNGYPCRIQYHQLYQRCRKYLNGNELVPKDFARLVQKHFSIPDVDCQLGITQIFLRLNGWRSFEQIQSMNEEETKSFSEAIAKLQSGRVISIYLNATLRMRVAKIQRAWKRYHARKKMNMLAWHTSHRLIPCLKLRSAIDCAFPRTITNFSSHSFNLLYEHYVAKLIDEQKSETKRVVEESNLMLRKAQMEREQALTKTARIELETKQLLEQRQREYDNVRSEIELQQQKNAWTEALEAREAEMARREAEILEKERLAELKMSEATEMIQRSLSLSDESTQVVGSRLLSHSFDEEPNDENDDGISLMKGGRGSVELVNMLDTMQEGFARGGKTKSQTLSFSDEPQTLPAASGLSSPYKMRASGHAEKKHTQSKGHVKHYLGHYTAERALLRGCKEPSCTTSEPVSDPASKTPERAHSGRAMASQGNTPRSGSTSRSLMVQQSKELTPKSTNKRAALMPPGEITSIKKSRQK